MKALLAKTAHTNQPWRIHEVAKGFEIYDVWALPTPGGPEDFPRLEQLFANADIAENPSRIFRALFALRWKLGEWFGWDKPDASFGARVTSLRERLPADLKSEDLPPRGSSPFTPLYSIETEWASELANSTCHGIMHIGWVPDPGLPGRFRGQMAVLVKPNGWFGRAYMAAIAPFRYLLVYPPLMRAIAANWLKQTAPEVHTEYEWSEPLNAEAFSRRKGHSNYSDVLTMATGPNPPARWWVHTMFEELIKTFGREVLFRGALALRPARGQFTLMDWNVAEESAEVIRLTRSGVLMNCVLTAESGLDAVRLRLSVEPRNRMGAAVWRKVSPLHRKMGILLLRKAWQRSQQAAATTLQ